MIFKYRLSPFGKFIIIGILCMIGGSIIDSMIEDEYLEKISEKCQKDGYYNTRKLKMNCQVIYRNF